MFPLTLLLFLNRQNLMTIFTEANPAGNITGRNGYFRFLMMILVAGISVSVKRVWLGYYFGRRICGRFPNIEKNRSVYGHTFFASNIALLSTQLDTVMIFIHCSRNFFCSAKLQLYLCQRDYFRVAQR
jgi:hypothetical protein